MWGLEVGLGLGHWGIKVLFTYSCLITAGGKRLGKMGGNFPVKIANFLYVVLVLSLRHGLVVCRGEE